MFQCLLVGFTLDIVHLVIFEDLFPGPHFVKICQSL